MTINLIEADPSSPEAIIGAGWQSIEGHPDTLEDPAIKAQVEFVGKEFHREAASVVHAGEPAYIPQSRRVRIVAGVGERQTHFQEAARVNRIHPSDLPHRPLKEARMLYDAADDGPVSFETRRKHGASQAGYRTDRAGTDPSARIPKSAESFLFQDTPAALAERSRRAKARHRRGGVNHPLG